jgi:hypothetical protein
MLYESYSLLIKIVKMKKSVLEKKNAEKKKSSTEINVKMTIKQTKDKRENDNKTDEKKSQ